MPQEYGLSPASPDETIVFGVRMPGVDDSEYDNEAVARWLSAVYHSGIRRMATLAHYEELEAYDLVLDVAYQRVFGRENVYSDEGIEDRELIDPDQLLDVFSFLQESKELNLPVAVHCGRSEFRTLQVLALWLMADKGLPAADAIATVRKSGRQPGGAPKAFPDDAALAAHLEKVNAKR